MDFQLRVKQKSEMENKELCGLSTKMELAISRDEMIRAYEEDEIQCCLEIRQIVYMYHYSYGYVTQLTDDTIQKMYYYIKENETLSEIVFSLDELEKIYSEKTNTRGHKVEIDTFYR